MAAAGFEDHGSNNLANAYVEWTPPQLRGASLRLSVDNLLDVAYRARTSKVACQFGTRDVQPT